MTAPVLSLELQQASRRGRLLKLWHVYFLWLVVQLLVLYANYSASVELRRFSPRVIDLPSTAALTGRFVNSYLATFVWQHFLLVLLATPAFVAGSISDEKTRGTLQFLLCADVSSWDIVAGKLLGRLAQVAFLASAGLPFVCFIGGFGGLDAWTLVGLAGVTAGPLFGLGAASILSSVWHKETRDAVLRVYVWLLCGWLGLVCFRMLVDALGARTPPGTWWLQLLEQCREAFACLDPLYVVQPSWETHDQGTMLERLGLAWLTWGGLGVSCTAVAVWRVRPAYLRQLEGLKRRRRARRSGKTLAVGDDPLAWKEREFNAGMAFRFLRFIPVWVYQLLLGAGTLALFVAASWGASGFAWFVPFAAVVLVGVRASAVVCRERDQQTWDTLLLTPLETGELLHGMQRGVLQTTYPYLRAYVAATVCAMFCGAIGIGIMALILMGLGWGAMTYMTGLGILCSVKSPNAWRSLLATLGRGFFTVFLVYFVSSFIVLTCGGCLLGAIVSAARSDSPALLYLLLGPALGIAYGFFTFHYLRRWGNLSLNQAARWIDKHERLSVYEPNVWHPSFPGIYRPPAKAAEK